MTPRSSMGERFAEWLVLKAARSTPPPLSERLAEEWLADLTAKEGQLSRLRFGLGCCWAGTVIMRELGNTAAAAAACSATGVRTMDSAARQDPAHSSRRAGAVFLIVCVHALLIFALASGLRPIATEPIQPTAGEILPAPRPPPSAPPPLTAPTFAPSPVIDAPMPPSIIDAPTPDRIEVRGIQLIEPREPARPVNRVPGGPDTGFPNTADYYPAASRRLAEAGTAAVRVCVDVAGKLTAHPTIAQSSGRARLDEGALELAQAGSGHYRATTEDGRPVDSCYVFRIRFELRD